MAAPGTGFTGAQNDEVDVLAEELGEDSSSTAEQRRIQDLVAGHVATVPAGRLPAEIRRYRPRSMRLDS
ncbi:hypothetical protein [Saccharopolyspora cebuensis]|uniref:Uncharacterized protein n=1 Tax=Saccharopolyspora cebuensis TaxID=418759 RepID=A0ABV4CSQ0_9PSEU